MSQLQILYFVQPETVRIQQLMETDSKADARTLVENAMKETGWTLDEIANRLDYASLKRAMSGEITFPENRRRHLHDLLLLNRAYGPKIVDPEEADPQLLETARTVEAPGVFQHRRVNHPIVERTESVQPAARVLKSPLDKHGENTTAELMIELLQDYRKSSGVKRQWLAGQIRDMASTLGATQETIPSPHE